ncbi:uncharacterized protein V3H82_023243 [Fundulus diaphanus]
MMTEVLITRLENILYVPGSGDVDQHMVTEVILPEVVIKWLQNNNLCRYQAEMMLINTVKKNEGLSEAQEEEDTEKGSPFIVDSQAAADWLGLLPLRQALRDPDKRAADGETRPSL